MAVTRLKRKGRRNKVVAKGKVERIKRLIAIPTIKKVDIEQLKEEYKASAAAEKGPKKEAKKTETPKDAVVETLAKKAVAKKEAPTKEEKPVAKKAATKKPTAKKASPKKKDK